MYFRKRIAHIKTDNTSLSSLQCSNVFESINKISLKPTVFESEGILTANALPNVIIIQAIVQPTFCENNNTFVRSKNEAPFFSLYDKGHPPLKKAIQTMALTFDGFILDPSIQIDYKNILEIPETLFKKDFSITPEGKYLIEEKRSPQDDDNQVLEQSLWSYGGTYNIDFDICQVFQTFFFPILLNGKTMIRSVRDSKSLSIGDSIINGKIKLKFKNLKKQFYYQSFFVKNITPTRVHIHLKKCLSE
ncbi:MAG: hypothetical protein KBD31_00990 [Proteobacteria bacterium]|nr:hypothetical protein [Pseudomonadota bacterium]